MALIAQDSFTEASDTNLENHTPDTGTGYSVSVAAKLYVDAAIDRCRIPSNDWGAQRYAREQTSIGDDDMDVSIKCTLSQDGTSVRAGAMGRIPSNESGNNNAYHAHRVGNGVFGQKNYKLDKVVAGSVTNLGTYLSSESSETLITVKLEIRSAVKKLYRDGVERLSSTDDSLVGNTYAGFLIGDTNPRAEDFKSASVLVKLYDRFSTAWAELGAYTPETGSAWAKIVGTAQQKIESDGNTLEARANTTVRVQYQCAAADAAATDEHDVLCNLKPGNTANEAKARIMGRCNGTDGNYYKLEIVTNTSNNHQAKLFKTIGGSDTQLGATYDSSTDRNTFARYKLEIRAAAKKVYLNDGEIISSADDSLAGNTRCGLESVGGQNARWDDYEFLEVAGAAGQTISPTGITSAEAFGTAQLNLILFGAGIASAEAVGSQTLTPGPVTVTPTGLVSAEGFGTSKLNFRLFPFGIAGAEAFGTQQLNLRLSPTGIASAGVFGTAQLNLILFLAGIAGAEAVGSTQLNLILFPTGVGSAEAVGSHTVIGGTVFIQPSGIASVEVFGIQQLNLTVFPAGLVSGEAVGTSTLHFVLFPTAIGTGEAVGTSQLNLVIFPDVIGPAEGVGSTVVLPGEVTLVPIGITSGEALGLQQLNLTLFLSAVGSAEAFGPAVILPGAVSVVPTGIGSAEDFGTGKLVIFLTPGGILTAEDFGNTTLSFVIMPIGIGSSEVLGVPMVGSFVIITGIPTGEMLGSATVIPGSVVIALIGIAAPEVFGTAFIGRIIRQIVWADEQAAQAGMSDKIGTGGFQNEKVTVGSLG